MNNPDENVKIMKYIRPYIYGVYIRYKIYNQNYKRPYFRGLVR